MRTAPHIVAAALVLVVFSTSGPVSAQVTAPEDRPAAEHTEEQQRLNDEAVRAIIAEDYPRAIALLEQALDIGESNLLYLNLGRAYQKFEKCEQARENYQNARVAPVLAEPAPELVDRKILEYDDELGSCPVVDVDAVRVVEGGEPAPGGTESMSEPVSASQESVHDSSARALPWVLIGTGGGLAATAGILHLLAVQKRNSIGGEDGGVAEVTYPEAVTRESTANTLDTIALGALLGGAAAAGTGAFLLVTDSEESRASLRFDFPGRLVFHAAW